YRRRTKGCAGHASRAAERTGGGFMLAIGRLPAPRGPFPAVALVLLSFLGGACRDDQGLVDPASPEAVAATPSLAMTSQGSDVIAGRYIVTFRRDVSDVPGLAKHLVADGAGTLRFTYTKV